LLRFILTQAAPHCKSTASVYQKAFDSRKRCVPDYNLSRVPHNDQAHKQHSASCHFFGEQTMFSQKLLWQNHRVSPQSESGKRVLSRVLKLLLMVAVAMYMAICLLLFFTQRQLIYHPPHFSTIQVDGFARQSDLERWHDASGEAIGFKRLSPRKPAVGQLLITYGNGGCSTGCAHYANDIQSVAALDAYILDYPGYADRPGSPTEKNFYRAADQALQLLSTNLPVYLLGESLGTGVASYLAGTHPDRIGGIVLLSPYDKLSNIAQHQYPIFPVRLLLTDRFPSADYLRAYHGPVAISLDGRDNILPPQFGKRLYDEYGGPKRLWEFPDGWHIAIGEPAAQFWTEVLGFWHANGK